jgi:hypothetical protein
MCMCDRRVSMQPLSEPSMPLLLLLLLLALLGPAFAIPDHLFRLYRGVSDEAVQQSTACARSEDRHVCADPSPESAGGAARDQSYCCVPTGASTDPNMNNCPAERPASFHLTPRWPEIGQAAK